MPLLLSPDLPSWSWHPHSLAQLRFFGLARFAQIVEPGNPLSGVEIGSGIEMDHVDEIPT